MKRLTAICCGLALAGAMACGDVNDTEPEDTGMQLSSGVVDGSDVEYMEYNIYKYTGEDEDCPPESYEPGSLGPEWELVHTKITPLIKHMVLPGDFEKFQNNPLHEDSQHKFADAKYFGEAGCYEVHVQPLKKKHPRVKSKDCLSTHGIFEIVPGDFKENFLISQCPGVPDEDGKGLKDMITVLNGPPLIDDFDYDPKFPECPEEGDAQPYPSTRVCVTAIEPEKDPVEIQFALQGFDNPFFTIDNDGVGNFHGSYTNGVKKVNYEPDNDYIRNELKPDDENPKKRVVEACVEIKFERKLVDTHYDLEVRVLDMLYDHEKGLITFEQYFEDRNIKDNGDKILSRAVQLFEVHVPKCDLLPVPDPDDFVCNKSQGWWKTGKVDEKWELTNYDRMDTYLCEAGEGDEPDDKNYALWFDILDRQQTYKSQYFNLARQYIAAELNFAGVNWSELVGDDDEDDFFVQKAEFFDLVLELTSKVLQREEKCNTDFTQKSGPEQKALISKNLEALEGQYKADFNAFYDTDSDDFDSGINYKDLDYESLKDLLENFNRFQCIVEDPEDP